ncbi:isopentenyl diphosphate isomerase/L-lactate dehydrogenase-like FMN-dependent dehydrogenase [Actinoplanes lutulentus]|uniref:Isopentenyl diphosphate isomerase/L-lactate dehydrogenase-like FMN-dependent dehydrogenase n=1 Tax=Actinoplanes lutulentus TaxID=1287878 RepID=A0A327Z2H4_9ACTN|nr:alpha-hydroxy-acid oxidizing protein [Actinoplanes lutulentus]MBB2940319.1 isopentenyl diphosphate isomerase/L-lactate dehydrogenase-like FMN-dependent dehydrogenase [Actinoplanes lutulentus]RAK28812.1 isopentenyl diphosphate isomerase/L-lactate dehydrogenase-like FMN-dependent dehydrogenase [Actinoplanes lutulentus]
MEGAGRRRQNAIYRAGVLGRRPAVPTDFAELERRAKKASSTTGWAYVAGGAGEGRTMRANRAAFDRWAIVPRMLRDVAERDLGQDLLGTRLTAPVLLAPVGAGQLIAADADLHTARAAAAAGVPYIFTNQGGTAMEETAAAMGAAPRWVQLYWSTDEALVDSLIHRAEAIDAGALVVTLDTTVLGWRPQDLNLGSLPFAKGLGIAQYTSDPRFQELVASRKPNKSGKTEVTIKAIQALIEITRNHPGRFWANLRSPKPRASVETFLDIYSNPRLSWDHIATLRERTRLPIVLKGILHPDDAKRAFDEGIDAIVVSNHGGRQVDNAIASLDALVRIRDAVGPVPKILMDSGIRTGADVFVAVALGADAVLLGRPYMYGLAIAGQRGIEEVIANVIAELDLTMALTGVKNLSEVSRELLVPNPA